jgi:hypothetical protein
MRGVALPAHDARGRCSRPQLTAQEHLMMDVLMLVLGFGFFAAAIGYTYACERL